MGDFGKNNFKKHVLVMTAVDNFSKIVCHPPKMGDFNNTPIRGKNTPIRGVSHQKKSLKK
jgi:hypothetical protein